MLPFSPKMRTLPRRPLLIDLYDALRAYVYCSGSAMLLWPAQYHTSPNVTSSMLARPVQPPVHTAVITYEPPGGCGGSLPASGPY